MALLGVIALEWDDENLADSICGQYAVQADDLAPSSFRLLWIAQAGADLFHSVLAQGLLTADEAKLTAQAHFERTILSAVEIGR